MKDYDAMYFDFSGSKPTCSFFPVETTPYFGFKCKSNTVSPTLYSTDLVNKFAQHYGLSVKNKYADFRLDPIQSNRGNLLYSIEFVRVLKSRIIILKPLNLQRA